MRSKIKKLIVTILVIMSALLFIEPKQVVYANSNDSKLEFWLEVLDKNNSTIVVENKDDFSQVLYKKSVRVNGERIEVDIIKISLKVKSTDGKNNPVNGIQLDISVPEFITSVASTETRPLDEEWPEDGTIWNAETNMVSSGNYRVFADINTANQNYNDDNDYATSNGIVIANIEYIVNKELIEDSFKFELLYEYNNELVGDVTYDDNGNTIQYSRDNLKVNTLQVGNPDAGPDASLSNLSVVGDSSVSYLNLNNETADIPLESNITISYKDSLKKLNVTSTTKKGGVTTTINDPYVSSGYLTGNKIEIETKDGNVTKTYTINITVTEASPDNELASITANKQATITKTEGKDEFVVKVPYSITDITLTPVLKENSLATFSPANIVLTGLSVGEITRVVTVTPEIGENRPYTIKIERLKGSDNTNLSFIKVNNDTKNTPLDASTFQLAEEDDAFTLTAGVEDPLSKIYYQIEKTGEYKLLPAVGLTVSEIGKGAKVSYNLKVISENKTEKVYGVEINRAKSSVKELSKVEITESGFANAPVALVDGKYTYTVKNNESNNIKVNIYDNPDENQTVRFLKGTEPVLDELKTSDLEYGSNEFIIEVTAQDGTVKTYPITIYKKSDLRNIENIKIVNTEKHQTITENLSDFDVVNGVYTLEINYEIADKIQIIVTTSDKSRINNKTTGTNVHTHNTQFTSPQTDTKTTGQLTVYAENEQFSNFEVRVIRKEASTDKTLKELTVDGTILEGFSPTTITYTNVLVLDRTITSFSVNGIANNEFAKVEYYADNIKQANGQISLSVGNKRIIKVKVIAQSGDSQEYEFQVIAADKDNEIKNIIVDKTSYSFDKTKKDQTITVPYSFELSTELKVVTANQYATVKLQNDATLSKSSINHTTDISINKTGTTVVTITAYAESGFSNSDNTYKITINRDSARTFNELESLTLRDKEGNVLELLPIFGPGENNYTLRIDDNDAKWPLNLTATILPNNGAYIETKGTVEYKTDISISSGTTREVVVRVYNEADTPREYKIIITRANNNNELDNIVIDDTNTISKESFTGGIYDLGEVPFTTKQIKYAINLVDSKATVEGLSKTGNYTLSDGKNEIKFKIKAQNGDPSIEYKVIVTRKAASKLNQVVDIKVFATYASGEVDLLDNVTDFVSNKSFKLRVDRNITSVIIVVLLKATDLSSVADFGEGVLEGENLRFEKVYNLNNEGTTTPINLKVRAQDTQTTSNDYSINVTRKNKDNKINSLEIKDKDGNIIYNGDLLSEVNLQSFAFSHAKLFITIEKNDPYARLYIDNQLKADGQKEVSEEIVLTTGANRSFKIRIETDVLTSESADFNSLEYTFKYLRQNALVDSKLNNLEIINNELDVLTQDPFSNLKNIYEVRVDNTTTFVLLNLYLDDSKYQRIEGTGISKIETTKGITKYQYRMDLEKGQKQTKKFVIKAEDTNNSTEYTINVHAKNAVNKITNIDVKDKLDLIAFDNGTLSYDLGNFAYSIKDITLLLEKEDESSKVYINNVLLTTDEYKLTLLNGKNTVSVRTETEMEKISGKEYLGYSTKTYTLEYTRENAQTYSFLDDLSIKTNTGIELLDRNYDENVEFNKEILSYELRLDRIYTSITIDATIDSKYYATVSGEGTQALILGKTNTFEIIVTAEDTTKQTKYIINITSKNDDNKINDIKVTDYEVDFMEETTLYDLGTVEYTVNSIDITAIKNDSNASLTGNGVRNLVDGENLFKVYATSEFGTKGTEYTIKVVRNKAYTEVDLSDLVVLDNGSKLNYDGVVNYVKGTYTYTITLKENQNLSSVSVVPTLLNEEKQRITSTENLDNIAITPNQEGKIYTVISFTVEAENNVSKVYTINIIKGVTLSSDNKLLDIILVDTFGDSYLNFEDGTYNYNVSILYKVEKLILELKQSHTKASIKWNNRLPELLKEGETIVRFVVVAEDKTESDEYTITITRQEASTNSLLEEMAVTVDGDLMIGLLDPLKVLFVKETKEYEITLNETYLKALITFKKGNEGQTVSGPYNQELTLKHGKNTYELVVTPESSGSLKSTYKVTINIVNSKNDITDIKISGFDDFVFDPLTTTYNLGKVDSSISKVNITALTTDFEYGLLEGVGEVSLKEGENIFKVKATSEDKTQVLEYEIIITLELNSDNSIESVVLTDGKTNYLNFDKDTLEYTITLPASVSFVDLEVLAKNLKATVHGNNRYNLEPEKELTITFYVEAENKEKSETYSVRVRRKKASSDATIKDLNLIDKDGNYIIGLIDKNPKEEFKSDKRTYNISLDRSHEVLYLSYILNSTYATSQGESGEIPLTAGITNVIRILVTAEDQTTKVTYVLNITVKESDIEIVNLEVIGQTLEFNKDVTEYDLGEVEENITLLDIKAVLSNPYGTLEGTGKIALIDGINTLTVKATSEDKTKVVEYIIKVTKKQSGSNRPKDSDSTLHDILIEGTKNKYVVPFDQSEYKYNLTIKHNDEQVYINPQISSYATVTGKGFHSILEGDTKTIKIQVTAEDGTIGHVYELVITREKASTDNKLVDLYVLEGSKKHQLDVNKSYQEVIVNPNTTEVNIVAVLPARATVENDGIKILQTSEDLYLVVVTSESGKSNYYQIKISKKNNDASLSSLVVKDNETGNVIPFNPLFDPLKLNYAIDLNNLPNVKELDIIAVPNSTIKSMTGNGIYTLKAASGETTEHVDIRIIAEDGTTLVYRISITRNIKPEDDISISDLTLFGDGVLYLGLKQEDNPKEQFMVSKTNYVVNVPYGLKNIILSAKSENSATLMGLNSYELKDKETTIIFKVISKSGKVESSSYIIKVVKEDPSKDNLLESITINNKVIENFDPLTNTYDIKLILEENNKIVVDAKLSDLKSTLSGNLGTITLVGGTNSIQIKVVSESLEENIYTLNISALSNLNEILDIVVDGYNLTPIFDKEVNNYTLTVKYEVTSVAVNVLASKNATIFGNGIKSLNEGKNEIIVYAKSEYGIQGNLYKVVIIREEVNKDSTLQTLIVRDGVTNEIIDFTRDFEKGTLDYIINLDKDSKVNTIVIEAKATSMYSFVTGDGYRILKAHDNNKYNNVFEIDVRAQSGDISTYTVSVLFDADLSDMVQMKSFSLFGSDGINYLGTATNALSKFDLSVLEYQITVPYGVKSLTANMIAEQGIVYGNETKTIGENTITFTLKIVSKSGTKELGTYTIKILKSVAVNNNFLKEIIINGVALKDFDKNITDYQIDIPYSTTNNVIITAETEDPKASLSGNIGTNKLLNGANVYKLNVQSEDGIIRTYTILVNYLNNNAFLDVLKISDSDTEVNYPIAFDPSIKEYYVVVEKTTKEVLISGMAQDQENAALIGVGKHKVDPQNPTKVIIIVVAADNKTKETYTVNISTNKKLSSDTLLEKLEITGYTINFDANRNQYVLAVNKNTSNLNINAVAKDTNASVVISNANDLKEGQNVIEIKVTAEDGTQGYYHVLVTRDAEPDMLLTVLLILSLLLWIITVLVMLIKSSRQKKNDRDDIIF